MTYDEESEPDTAVSPTSREGGGSAHDRLIEPLDHPGLSWHECTTGETDEESDGVESSGILCCSCETSGEGGRPEDCDEDFARTEAFTKNSSSHAHDEGCGTSDDCLIKSVA